MSRYGKTTGVLVLLLAFGFLWPVTASCADPSPRRIDAIDVATALPRAFAGMPLAYIEAHVVTDDGKPCFRYDASRSRVTVDCEISVNLDSYRAWAERARRSLDPIAAVRSETEVVGAFETPEDIIRAARGKGAAFGPIGVFILEPLGQPGRKLADKEIPWRISWHGFDEDKRGALNGFGMKTLFGVKLGFFTATGEKVTDDVYGTWHGSFYKTGPSGTDRPVCVFYPGFPFENGTRSVHLIPMSFDGFSPETVGRIGRIDAHPILAW